MMIKKQNKKAEIGRKTLIKILLWIMAAAIIGWAIISVLKILGVGVI